METKTREELWQEFTEHMEREDARVDALEVSVGQTNKSGNLLILGGVKANLWKLSSGLYAVGLDQTAIAGSAVELYNQYNGTSLRLDYITEVFYPWYEKQFKVITEVPSSSQEGVTYKIRRSPDGKLVCDPKCMGFRYRGTCWHIEAIKAAEEEAS